MERHRPDCQTCPWLSFFGIPEDDEEGVRVVRWECERRDVENGECVHLPGHDLGGAVFVKDGLLSNTATAPSGREWVSDLLEPGMAFGLAEHQLDRPCDMRLVAEEPSSLCWISHRSLRVLFGAWPAARDRMMELLARRVLELERRNRDLVLKRVEDRFLVYLLDRAEERGQEQPDGTIRVSLPAKQQTVAARLGAVREHLSRVMRALREEGVIDGGGRTIRIVDLERLRARVESLRPRSLAG